jgi:cytidylate kinase
VRLIGLPKDRIAAVARRLNLAPEAAARKVEEIDRERSRFIRDHFQFDATDPHQYDVILNTSRWSVPQCADLVVQALHRLASMGPGSENPGYAPT